MCVCVSVCGACACVSVSVCSACPGASCICLPMIKDCNHKKLSSVLFAQPISSGWSSRSSMAELTAASVLPGCCLNAEIHHMQAHPKFGIEIVKARWKLQTQV